MCNHPLLLLYHISNYKGQKGYSLNAIKEFRSYKWATDKNGDVLNVPVKVNDHLIDATRYLCLNKLSINHSGKYYIL